MGVNLIVDLILKKYGGSVDLNLYKNMGAECYCRFEIIKKNIGIKLIVDLTLNKTYGG